MIIEHNGGVVGNVAAIPPSQRCLCISSTSFVKNVDHNANQRAEVASFWVIRLIKHDPETLIGMLFNRMLSVD
ncbi:hypothetical protein ITX54_10945 [Rouxiella silvae]|uniref:Uncharacterized protein n=1 Tax=Rouxiella silvae TaxID=1646373 RepID=A0AA41BWR4_9GAMM|nr:hypothetical protein [Rouxiella silvae]MBF6637169.1 hypothetical protein [Rouxiella silvae]